jgi:hypothetical protein
MGKAQEGLGQRQEAEASYEKALSLCAGDQKMAEQISGALRAIRQPVRLFAVLFLVFSPPDFHFLLYVVFL